MQLSISETFQRDGRVYLLNELRTRGLDLDDLLSNAEVFGVSSTLEDAQPNVHPAYVSVAPESFSLDELPDAVYERLLRLLMEELNIGQEEEL